MVLQSISVNGQTLAIDSSVFATTDNGGTIIDSGTTLAYLAEEAYDPFVNAVSKQVSMLFNLCTMSVLLYEKTSKFSILLPFIKKIIYVTRARNWSADHANCFTIRAPPIYQGKPVLSNHHQVFVSTNSRTFIYFIKQWSQCFPIIPL